MTTENRLPTEDALTFVKAGKAIFTVKNENTQNRFTYLVISNKRNNPNADKELWWVRVLTGSDNNTAYKYLGMIGENGTFRRTQASDITEEAQSHRVFKWLWEKLTAQALPPYVSIYHEGRCGRCGRRLTVPESILSGYGPECIMLVRR